MNTETPDNEPRLNRQLKAVRDVMLDGSHRTLDELSTDVEQAGVRCPPASASARLRDLRKPQYGGYHVEKKNIGNGLYVYWLVVPAAKQQTLF